MSVSRVKSKSTTVGFTIGDDNAGDQIGVSIFADPVYGTPIFVTTGGWTRCPREPGTNPREEMRVFPETDELNPIELVQEDPSAEIELDISGLLTSQRLNDGGGSFTFLLQVYNEDDLSVIYKGEEVIGIGGNIEVQINNQDFTSFGPIRARRGKKFQYDGVRLTLTSACDDGVGTRTAVDGAVYYNLKW